MAEYRWYDVLNEITKVERKYNIKNPNWDNGFPGVFRDYGFVPVDTKGDWWTRIPDAPELPIIYAPVANTSYTIPTGIGTTTTTGLIDTVNVIGDATYTELPTGETVATVTSAGAVSATSSAVATAAAGAAIGFGVGVAAFEIAPEFWTKVSNAVFGTDLDPAEIGQMARDTNALVVIKDGICYMAEDMINAIRNAFFVFGAATAGITPGSVNVGDTVNNVVFTGTVSDLMFSITPAFLDFDSCTSSESYKNTLKEIYAQTGYVYALYEYDVTYKQTKVHLLRYENLSNYDPETDYLVTYYNITQYKQVVRYNGLKTLFAASKFSAFDLVLNANGKWYIDGAPRKDRTTTTTSVILGIGKYSNITTSYISSYISNANATITGGVPGITPTGDQGTKDQPLAVLFPEWVNKGIETVAGDGVTKVKWLPVSLPKDNPLVSGNPFTTDKAQNGTLPDNYTETASQLGEQAKEQTKNAPSYPTPPITPVPDVTPTPDDPAIAGGGGSATGLANLYNPTLAQVKQFSRWLWGSDGLNLDQLKKLLQDPMQAIIGLHVMYATPTTGADRDIQVGYINSGVTSKIVTEQYTEIDCGTVTINEYFGDARDYSPFTQVYCYLPFIGIVELNADDVVNSVLGIKYKIDVLTGCCLAQLTVKKYGLDAVLYTYTGNCAVQMPITSGNYLSTVSSLLGVVVSAGTAALTGGALAPVAIEAATSAVAGGAKASVAMSGSLGSNAGAMGIRKPYLIIKRVESADANGYNEFYGYPTNKRVNLSQLTGYVRVKDINLSGTNATEDEQNEIVTLLKEGVIL